MNTIGFKNFKAFGDTMQTFSNKPITLIYGPNSVGKSSILHALMYAKEIIGGANPDIMKLDDSVDLGGFKNFIHKHDENRKFEFEEKIANNFEDIANIMVANNSNVYCPSYMWAYGIFNYEKTEKYSKEFEKTEAYSALMTHPLYMSISDIIELHDKKEKIENMIKEEENNFDGNIKITDNVDTVKKWYKEIVDSTFGIQSVKIKLITELKKFRDLAIFFNCSEYIKITLELYFNNELYATADFSKKLFNNFFDDTYNLKLNYENSILKNIANFVGCDKNVENAIKAYRDNYKKEQNVKQNYFDLNNYDVFKIEIEKYNSGLYIGTKNLIEEFQKHKNPWLLFGEIANIWFQTYIAKYINNNWQHIEPLRYYPERSELVFEPSHSNLSTLELNSKDIWKIITLDETNGLLNKINEWLSDENKLNTPYRIEVNKFYKEDPNNKGKILTNDYITKLEFLDIRKNTLVSPRDMGLGVSQVLPILASCYTETYEKVDNDKQIGSNSIYIEQPELHLHPKQQCELADEFIMAVKSGKKRLYIETHSEHLLLRIMKRLRHSAQGKISKDDPLYITPDDICLLYVDNKDDGNGAYIDELKLSENGELLTPWHGGFFDESFKERFE